MRYILKYVEMGYELEIDPETVKHDYEVHSPDTLAHLRGAGLTPAFEVDVIGFIPKGQDETARTARWVGHFAHDRVTVRVRP